VGGSGVLSFAGCDAPHWWSEVHHLVHWTQGGETSLENSGLLCERHHTKVHHGFTVERDEQGRWHTFRRDGTEIHVIRPPTRDPDLARAG
jgi:5-methylcytosine-specific restriction endonuclease McrA